MTKNKILIIVITFLLFLCLVKTETKAFPNNEFITGGVNFIDPDNIQFIPGNYSKEETIKTIAPFKIVWGEEYYICSIMFNDINFGGATVTEYDGVKTEIKKSELNTFWVNNYISFKVSNDTFYLSFEIEVKLNNTSNISLYDISNYVMIKSKAIPKDNFKDYALTYPDRCDLQAKRLSLTDIGTLHFSKPDTKRFPALDLAYKAGRTGGSMPCVLNAANEVANALFRAGKITFLDIFKLVKEAMDHHDVVNNPSLDELLEIDQKTRDYVKGKVGE